MPLLSLANSLLDRDTLGKSPKLPLTTDPATGMFQIASDEDEVKESIILLLDTRIGERVMAEDVGTLISQALFSNIEALRDILPGQIVEAISNFEPRVENVRATSQQTGPTELRVTVTWVVSATGRADSLIYPFYTEPPAGGISQ